MSSKLFSKVLAVLASLSAGLAWGAGGITRAGWESIGPYNEGGRVQALATRPGVVFIGGKIGGVWKSIDRGQTWTHTPDGMENTLISTFAVDPTNTSTLYAGTGVGSERGMGIFKTVNGGNTWEFLPSSGPFPDGWDWSNVNKITVSPVNPGLLWIATENGIWMGMGGGSFWVNTQFGSWGSVQAHATDENKAIAGGMDGQVFFTDNSNTGWTPVNLLDRNNAPLTKRVEVAYAPSDPGIAYAFANSGNGEVYRSTDGGHTYVRRNTNAFSPSAVGTLGQDGLVLWVDPANPDHVVVGGVNLFQSTNGGQTFTLVNSGLTARQTAVAGDPSSPLNVFVATQRGTFRFDSPGLTNMTSLNGSFANESYLGGAANDASGFVSAVQSDNVTRFFTGNISNWAVRGNALAGVATDPLADEDGTTFWYRTSALDQVSRDMLSVTGTVSQTTAFTKIVDGGLSPSTAFLLDPNDGARLYRAGSAVWRLDNPRSASATAAWVRIKAPGASFITAVAVKPGNSDVVVIGQLNGQLFQTNNARVTSPTWFQLAGGQFASRINKLVYEPTGNVLYAALGSSGSSMWGSFDGGTTWSNLHGNLPAGVVNSVAVKRLAPYSVYVAMDQGVFASDNQGSSWSTSNDGPSDFPDRELFWENNKLLVTTSGHGVYRHDLNQPPASTLTYPTNNTAFTMGVPITLKATASDADGVVKKVEFFKDGTKIGEDLTAPYSFTWSNPSSGSYLLFARALDNDRAVTGTVSPASVTGNPPVVGNSTADASVKDGTSAGTNFGTATTLEVRNTGTSTGNREAYLKFGLGGLSGVIQSAKLRIFAGLSASQTGSVTTDVHGVSSTTWTETGITWNNKPSRGSKLGSTSVSSTTQTWKEIDVTAYVRSQRNAGLTALSLGLHNPTVVASTNPFVMIDSKEGANDPQLSVAMASSPGALFVVGNTTLSPSDAAIRTRLQNMGFTVTVKSGLAASSLDANGRSLVFISASVTSGDVNSKFRNSATPVVNCEQAIQDDMGMTGTTSGTDFGVLAGQTQVVMSAGNALTAGLTGTQTAAASGGFNWGVPASAAIKVATVVGSSTHFAEYAYEAGADMVGLKAPARRANLFLTDSSPTASGWALFETAVIWAAGF